jgi:hypothetical protein
MDSNKIRDWLVSHQEDYASVRERLEAVRNIVFHGRIECAADVLEKAYVNAVMSIRTDLDRHEPAFVAYYRGDASLKEASLQTVYGGQKARWMYNTFSDVDWEVLARAVRSHVRAGRYAELLDTVDDKLTGVAHRKGAFMLAMSGIYEYMCVDSNVARYAGLDESDSGSSLSFTNASEYLDKCQEIHESVGNPYVPPFIVQWAIYDCERGEHARHMVYFNEVFRR